MARFFFRRGANGVTDLCTEDGTRARFVEWAARIVPRLDRCSARFIDKRVLELYGRRYVFDKDDWVEIPDEVVAILRIEHADRVHYRWGD